MFYFQRFERKLRRKWMQLKNFLLSKNSLYTLVLLELGVAFVILNHIYLSFIQIHATFYFNYTIYSGLLIFCRQNVAMP